jgi:hypothetical protein
MGISHYQEVVIQYIIADPAVLVSEEYHLNVKKISNTDKIFWVDALAADIREHILYLVEISYAKKPRALTQKMNDYVAYEEQIRRALVGERGVGPAWELRPWGFIIEAAYPYLEARLSEHAKPKLTFLEHTPFPWVYENIRYEGKEPGKPYSAVPPSLQ